LIAKDWIVLEIDTDRMTNGKQVEERLTSGVQKGYPWSVILDDSGVALADADGPEGNIGCPVQPAEAAHFFSMLETTRQRLTDDELERLKQEHAAFAKPILERTSRR
jgi:hypothetical protein